MLIEDCEKELQINETFFIQHPLVIREVYSTIHVRELIARILRHTKAQISIQYEGLEITCLLHAGDVPSNIDLQFVFHKSECQSAPSNLRPWFSTKKNKVRYVLQERGEILPLAKECKSLGISLTHDGDTEQIRSVGEVLKFMSWSLAMIQWVKFEILVTLYSYLLLCFWDKNLINIGNDQKNKSRAIITPPVWEETTDVVQEHCMALGQLMTHFKAFFLNVLMLMQSRAIFKTFTHLELV